MAGGGDAGSGTRLRGGSGARSGRAASGSGSGSSSGWSSDSSSDSGSERRKRAVRPLQAPASFSAKPLHAAANCCAKPLHAEANFSPKLGPSASPDELDAVSPDERDVRRSTSGPSGARSRLRKSPSGARIVSSGPWS